MKTMGVWKSIDVCTIVWVCIVLGIKSIDTWLGTLYLVYGLGLETLPTSFLVRVEFRRALRILYMCFGKGLVAN